MNNHGVPSKVIMKDLEDVLAVFKKHGVKAYLCYGAILGSVRENDFIKWDDDIDLAVIDPIDLQTRKSIGWMLYDLGFRPQPITFRVFDRMEPGEIGYNGTDQSGIIVCERGFKFSIFFFKEVDCPKHGRELICMPKLGSKVLISTPAKFFDKPSSVKMHGVKFECPGPVMEYIEHTYGKDWKQPSGKHADQYFEIHMENPEMLDLTNKNEVVIYNK